MTAATIDDAAIIRSLEAARFEAMEALDATKLDEILADDFRYTHSNGSVETKAQLLGRLGKDQARYRNGRFHSLDVRLYGDTAIVNGHFALSVFFGERELQLDALSLSAWVKTDRWRQVATASTPILGSALPPSAGARP